MPTSQFPFLQFINLAQPRLGGKVIYATDDFFADKSRLIEASEPVFIADKYDANGKWMDGWESRRKRSSGYDFCVLKLGQAGTIKGFDIDTRHFTGNFAPSCSIDAWTGDGECDVKDQQQWQNLLPTTDLRGDQQHFISIDNQQAWQYLKLNIYPDGGVARLRVYGQIARDWSKQANNELIDLGAMLLGARAVACNNQHFGHMSNLTAPGRGVNMGDGWETRRRRRPGFDWAIIKLAHPGVIKNVEIDTAHFKGNYPDSASLSAASMPDASDQGIAAESLYWQDLLPPQKLGMDALHTFAKEVKDIGPVSHVRLNIFPDGGVSRLRLFGIAEN